MKLTAETTQFCIDAVTAMVAEKIAQRKGMTHTEALRFFMLSDTFDLLIEPKSYLFLESVEYTLDMLDAELKGDRDRWLLI